MKINQHKTFYQIAVKGGRLKATIEVFNENHDDTYQTVYTNESPVHQDLTDALQQLRLHVEKITGAGLPTLWIDGYYRRPSGNSELLTIYAHLGVAVSSPTHLAVRLHLGRDEYAWIDKLLEDLSRCETEALLYIVEGKRLGIERFLDFESTDWQEAA